MSIRDFESIGCAIGGLSTSITMRFGLLSSSNVDVLCVPQEDSNAVAATIAVAKSVCFIVFLLFVNYGTKVRIFFDLANVFFNVNQKHIFRRKNVILFGGGGMVLVGVMSKKIVNIFFAIQIQNIIFVASKIHKTLLL